jgi:hypothetical protein
LVDGFFCACWTNNALIAKETAWETGLGIAEEQQFLPTACQVCIHCMSLQVLFRKKYD